MGSTAASFECDYLRAHTPAITRVFSSEQAELAHINEQIRSLDSHISQLNTLRHALHHRSCQLHNLFPPIQNLPIEVLSCIFQQVINLRDYDRSGFDGYRACLHQALVLSSVSAHFRRVALYTPDLWKRIPLRITSDEAIGKVSSLLQHCMALTVNINIFVLDELAEEEAIEILLTPDTMRKITAFGLHVSTLASDLWIDKLKDSSFLMFDTLSIGCYAMDPKLSADVLETMTQLHMYRQCSLHPNRPSSMQYLNAYDIQEEMLISLLYQCPNLVECLIAFDAYFDDLNAQFDKPLTLSHLKCLTLDTNNAFTIPSSVQNLQLPSLETLRFKGYSADEFNGIVLLCRNVSSTLINLSIYMTSDMFEHTTEHHDLHQLRNLPFPNLQKLGLGSRHGNLLLRFVCMLTLWSDERGNTKLLSLPSLTALTLSCASAIAEGLLNLLDKRMVDGALDFHVEVRCYDQVLENWSPELREELRSIVGDHHIGATLRDRRILLLLRRRHSSLS